jgi:stearoyl-CoA desaturase (delta-9 desaturase)
MATPPAQHAAQAPSSLAKPSEPNRSKKYDPKKPHITEEPITRYNWYKHVNWLNVTLIVGVPLYGMVAAYWTPLQWKTFVWAVAYYFMTGLGITAGKWSWLDANVRRTSD